MIDPVEKAAILIEALPQIQALHGRTVVVKYGGATMENPTLRANFALEIVLLHHIGVSPVVVHGGGPQITRLLEKMEIPTRFVSGQRVTDEATMEVVEMVLGGRINAEIVQSINRAGGQAVGISGRAARMIKARKQTGGEADLGLVGEITQVDPGVIQTLLGQRYIPVVAPVGIGEDGQAYNINADFAAAAVAGSLKAEKLVMLTDVPGVLDAGGKLISSIRGGEAENLIADGIITGGMIPKIRQALLALQAGVRKAHVIDGRMRHALLLELLTQSGIGTEIIGD